MRERATVPIATRAKERLASLRGSRPGDRELADHAQALARTLLELSAIEQTADERARAALLSRMMADEHGPAFTTLLTDRAYRSRDPARAVDAARSLLRALGIPPDVPVGARLSLRALLHAGPFVPETAAKGMWQRMQHEVRHVVLPAEDPELARYLERRRADGVRVNANHLGEAVLGEDEARARVADYIALLSRPDIEAISVKLSSIFSQIDLLAWRLSAAELRDRLRPIYRAALAHRYQRPDGTSVPKLVNLDMEAYRDLRLTLEVFCALMDEPELLPLGAGVVLQAYLPDSAPLQEELTAFARARVERGGAPIRLRVVKGANLLTERAESAVRGWPLPIFGSKAEVDASWKRMVEYGCRPEHARAVELGVASHNLFDIAFAMVLRAANEVEPHVSFELLEGMADPLQRAISAVAGDTLVYAPLVSASSMQTAIAYLMRRLDENTAEQNFLRHSFGMQPDDAAYTDQARQFSRALEQRGALDHTPRRQQDRGKPQPAAAAPGAFANEPDTDFALAANRAWLDTILERWRTRAPFVVPLQIGGELRQGGRLQDGFDPSRPELVPYRFALADAAEIERALATADTEAERMRRSSVQERAGWLRAIAAGLRRERGELIAAMVLDAGKRVDQADTEISEAIDFAEYYAESFGALCAAHPEIAFAPRGPTLVTPPWNFPLAIPAGGAVAALMAGNSVLLKPALETVLVAERFAQLCWEAGVPRRCLQLVLCEDELGSTLIRDARIRQVVLTGATSTARLFLSLRPSLTLSAETGGKNAIVVSALADRDEAIKDVLGSAFGHAGQKCSACSLLVCEAEVYDDASFMRTLADAAASLPVGSSWDPRSVVTPLIRPPEGPLRRALDTLDEGESWLCAPRADASNPRLYGPGIKIGVREGSPSHTTELFGPVLSVMRADDLEHALRIANATSYGLTAGLFSLEEQEQRVFAAGMHAGNLYINRVVTGAIVRRQPFGGCKGSSVGAGAKAGGPNYVAQLTEVAELEAPAVTCPPHPAAAEMVMAVRRHLDERTRERLGIGACSYEQARRAHFAVDHDESAVLGERNVFRYLPSSPLLIRAAAHAAPGDVLLACAAALTAGAQFELSIDEALARTSAFLGEIALANARVEPAATAAARVSTFARVRAIGTAEPEIDTAAREALLHVERAPVLLTGRIELLRYYREQSVSHRYHRYGNLAPALLLPALRKPHA